MVTLLVVRNCLSLSLWLYNSCMAVRDQFQILHKLSLLLKDISELQQECFRTMKYAINQRKTYNRINTHFKEIEKKTKNANLL